MFRTKSFGEFCIFGGLKIFVITTLIFAPAFLGFVFLTTGYANIWKTLLRLCVLELTALIPIIAGVWVSMAEMLFEL